MIGNRGIGTTIQSNESSVTTSRKVERTSVICFSTFYDFSSATVPGTVQTDVRSVTSERTSPNYGTEIWDAITFA